MRILLCTGRLLAFFGKDKAFFFIRHNKGETRVSDPHWLDADPDPAFFLIADPDPGFWLPKIDKSLLLKIKF
jgi:hypothetical protein